MKRVFVLSLWDLESSRGLDGGHLLGQEVAEKLAAVVMPIGASGWFLDGWVSGCHFLGMMETNGLSHLCLKPWRLELPLGQASPWGLG